MLPVITKIFESPYLLVAAGSAIGGVCRHALSMWSELSIGTGFPWGTIAINVIGSFAIGLIAGLTECRPVRHFVMVGILGGFTTFSSFSLQTLNLAQQGEMARAGANIGLSVVLCLCAVWLGFALAKILKPLPLS